MSWKFQKFRGLKARSIIGQVLALDSNSKHQKEAPMGLRQRAKEAWDQKQQEILAGKIRDTRKLLRERFGVKDEEMDTFEAASIGLCGADKTIRVEDLLFMVNDEGVLCVRDQRVTQHQENPWKPVESLAELGALTAQSNATQLPRI